MTISTKQKMKIMHLAYACPDCGKDMVVIKRDGRCIKFHCPNCGAEVDTVIEAI